MSQRKKKVLHYAIHNFMQGEREEARAALGVSWEDHFKQMLHRAPNMKGLSLFFFLPLATSFHLFRIITTTILRAKT